MSYYTKYCGSLVDTINESLMHGTTLLPYYGDSGPNRIIRNAKKHLPSTVMLSTDFGQETAHSTCQQGHCAVACGMTWHRGAGGRTGCAHHSGKDASMRKGTRCDKRQGHDFEVWVQERLSQKAGRNTGAGGHFFLDVCLEWVFLKVEVAELYVALVENIFMDIFVHCEGLDA